MDIGFYQYDVDVRIRYVSVLRAPIFVSHIYNPRGNAQRINFAGKVKGLGK